MSKLFPEERISRKAFESLNEYSCSFPTLTTIGKVWRCNMNYGLPHPPDWMICEFVELSPPVPGRVGIEYRTPVFID
jgi:hypothetical protein